MELKLILKFRWKGIIARRRKTILKTVGEITSGEK